METRIVNIGGLDYQITEESKIHKRRGKGFLRCFPDKDGYLKVSISFTGGRTYNEPLHRVVYRAFHGEIPEGYTIDHIDSDRTNNHFSNLQLMTAEENAVKGNARHWKFLSPQQEVVEIYNLAEFCRNNGLHLGHMCELHRNPKRKHHKGWKVYV